MHKINISENESGVAIVLALMLLSALMMAGVMISSTSITDFSATKNTVIHTENAAFAESAAMVAAQLLENEKDSDLLDPARGGAEDYIVADPKNDNYAEDYKTEKWIRASSLDTFKMRPGHQIEATYMVIGWEQSQGASLGQYAATLKEGRILGQYNSEEYGVYRVELGFKKRF